MRPIFFLTLLLSSLQTLSQHNRYEIVFTNKSGTPYTLSNPTQYLSQRALDRRQRYGIGIDSLDLPVSPRYLDSLRAAGNVAVLNVSKWLNSVTISTTDANALNRIRAFPFVRSTKAIAAHAITDDRSEVARISQPARNSNISNGQNLLADFYNYGASDAQIRIHNGQFLHNLGLRGQDMIIGMLDAGYFNYTSLRAFDSVRAEGRILDTWDFVDRHASVVEDHPHGMYCFSIIAANIPGSFVGSAPKASFYLYKTEDVTSEYPVEEHNWVVAAERVDSAGGDLISSSLGYTTFDDPSFNYSYNQMNGRTAISSRGAVIAARKGLLVVNSAGNEGQTGWRYISAPADADSILAVGAVNTSGMPAGFSSYGPTADGRVKPDVVSVGVGTVLQGTNNTVAAGNGTSFSCPNMAGLAACLWQGFREVHPVKIIKILQQAATHYPGGHPQLGYGIPDVKKAMALLLRQTHNSSASVNNCAANITWQSRDVSSMRYELQRKTALDTAFKKVYSTAGSGSLLAKKSYQYSDNLLDQPQGNILYRVVQVIDTSSGSFSQVILDTLAVHLDRSCISPGGSVIVAYPNPGSNEVKLKLTMEAASEKLTVQFLDVLGRLVHSSASRKAAGPALFAINTSNLPAGKYLLVVYDGERKIGATEWIKTL